MKKTLLLLLAGLSFALLLYGCSQDPAAPVLNDQQIQLVQRPEFVDLRPETEIQSAIVRPSANYVANKKKPPKPDPEPDPEPGDGEDPNPDPAHKYAYIVGISDYEGTVNDLSYCDDDATDMKAYFASQGFTVKIDTDRSATAAAIGAGLDWLVASASPGDEVAFCYSGHGDDPREYGSCLISTDLYYVTQGYVMEKFNAIDCSKKIMTVDACLAGGFHDEVVVGTLMATASDNTYSYDAPEFQNGAWTHFFLEGAEDLGMVFGEDIAGYAKIEMKAWGRLYHLRTSALNTDAYTGMFDI